MDKWNVKYAGLAFLLLVALGSVSTAGAATLIIPDSALTPSGQYYTDMIGGGIGTALIMTGGGNAANVGFSRNDDGFSGPINLGFTLNFFSTNYTQFWANNNGNISFTGGISAFTPSGPTGVAVPIISPFFADVDTRNVASGLMYLRNDITNEIIVTWDAVGHYNQSGEPFDSFQLVVRGPDYVIPAGEGTIGFFYKDMGWERGDVSSVSAAVGFGDGLGNGEVLASSTAVGISRIVNDHYIWFDQNLAPIPTEAVPEPSTIALLGLGLAAAGFVRRRRT
jgi:hypothetical protein